MAKQKAKKTKKMKYAGFWVRFGAFILDAILSVLTGGLYWFYMVWTVGKEGMSVGKQIMKLRVVNEQRSSKIGLNNAIIREVLGKFVSGIILGLGYLLIVIDDKKQGLHDKIAKTYVIQED